MPMVTGQGAALQLGEESTWGTKVTPTVAINFTSEGFKPGIERKEEDSLIGGATASAMDIMRKSASFTWEQLARPENIGFVLAMALGEESDPEQISGSSAYKHTFTLLRPSLTATLKKFTAVVNRHVHVKAYTGCKIDTMSIRAEAGDYMRISVSGKGRAEEDASVESGLSVPSLKAFRFAGGKATFDSVDFGDVTNVQWDLSNNLDDGEQTLGSGYYSTEPEPQKRDVKVSLDTFFNQASDTVRSQKYLSENTVNVSLVFESPDYADASKNQHYSIQIDMPLLVLDSCDPNIAGPGKIVMPMSGTATESASTQAVTVTLIDKYSSKYSS